MTMRWWRIALGAAALLAPGATAAADFASSTTVRVSVASHGRQANADSFNPALSADGRFVAFTSFADNLVKGDTNGSFDVFVHDRMTGRTERVSVRPHGGQADAISDFRAISADGRFVAFNSCCTNLITRFYDYSNVYVRDRRWGTTEQVSVGPRGPSDQDSGTFGLAISADGRFVAFNSFATNLVEGDTNDQPDIFVRDRKTGRTKRVSVGPHGVQGDGYSGFGRVALSAGGRFVAFDSRAANLVPGDTNGNFDVFVHDRMTGRTELVSVGLNGAPADRDSLDPALSADGRFVAFVSSATNLVKGASGGLFVRDRKTGRTELVVADGGLPSLSADGRFVAFVSSATDLVSGDTNGQPDIFVRDRKLRTTVRVSVGPHGEQADDGSGDINAFDVALSADGRAVAFTSFATNLVKGDTNRVPDIFVHTR